MKLTSPHFQEGGIIPSKYTCEGKGINPRLNIAGVPKEAKSLVLLMDDPDVPPSVRPDCMFDHWVIFNMPPATHTLEENAKPPGLEGRNTAGKNRYFGPCPPDREHRYFFKLFALSKELDLKEGATKKEVEHAMEGAIIARTVLMGRYEKGKSAVVT